MAAVAKSEYQYYEFQAIDRPLGEADRKALRDLSTRARINATSFTNAYEWGDFKGDPGTACAQGAVDRAAGEDRIEGRVWRRTQCARTGLDGKIPADREFSSGP